MRGSRSRGPTPRTMTAGSTATLVAGNHGEWSPCCLADLDEPQTPECRGAPLEHCAQPFSAALLGTGRGAEAVAGATRFGSGSALIGNPLPYVRSVDARVVAGHIDPRPVAVELVAVPDDVVVQGHQGPGNEVVGVDGVGLRRHDRVVARGDQPRWGVDLLQLGVGEQRWAARLEGLDN